MGLEIGEFEVVFLQEWKQPGQSLMRLIDGEVKAAAEGLVDVTHGGKTLESVKKIEFGRMVDGDLDDVLGVKRSDQLGGSSDRDDLAAIDDGDAIGEFFRFVHVVSGEEDRSPVSFE